jgi:hypothetical protein
MEQTWGRRLIVEVLSMISCVNQECGLAPRLKESYQRIENAVGVNYRIVETIHYSLPIGYGGGTLSLSAPRQFWGEERTTGRIAVRVVKMPSVGVKDKHAPILRTIQEINGFRE